MRARRLTALTLASVLALSGAACGGGDDEATDDASGSASASGTEETTTTEEASGDDGEASGVPDFSGLGECLEIAGAYVGLGMAFLGGSFGGEDIDVEQVVADLEEVAADAPGDVQDAFDVVIDAYEDVVENLDGDLSAIDLMDPATAEAMEPLNTTEFNEANTVITDYFDEICAEG